MCTACIPRTSGRSDKFLFVMQACIDVCPSNPTNFNVDNVRVVKIPGSGPHDSQVVQGVVVKRGTEGTVQSVEEAKVAVFAQGVDTASTETKVGMFGSIMYMVASCICRR